MRNVCIPGTIVAILLAAAPAAADWQGERVTEDGKTIVRNPETAVETVAIEMDEVWRRGEMDDDIFFGMPVQVVEDDAGNAYVLDSQVSEILVFSPAGDYLRTVGREGEGPGEFRNANDLFLRSDGVLGVVIVFPGSIVQLTTDGTPVDRFPVPAPPGGGFQLIYKAQAAAGRVFLAGGIQSRTDGGRETEQENYLEAFDYEGTEVAHFYSVPEQTRFGGMTFDEKVFSTGKNQWSASPDGRAAAALEFDDYRIHVWNPDGSLDYVIERPGYEPLERTDRQLQRFQKLYEGVTRWNPDSSFETSPTHRAVAQLYFRPDGSLWVLSGRGVWARGEGVFAAFDVYDTEGRFVRHVALKGPGGVDEDGIYLAGDRVYRITDQFSAFMANFGGDVEADENAEPLQVVAYDVGFPAVGSR